jgi:hypothetical protein
MCSLAQCVLNGVKIENYLVMVPWHHLKFLKSSNSEVHTSTALHQLSKNPENCIIMHDVGAVRVSTNDALCYRKLIII